MNESQKYNIWVQNTTHIGDFSEVQKHPKLSNMLLRDVYTVLVIQASYYFLVLWEGADKGVAWRDWACLIQSFCLFLPFYHRKNEWPWPYLSLQRLKLNLAL